MTALPDSHFLSSLPPWLAHFLIAFIPLFVAIDPIGLVPIYLTMAGGVKSEKQHRIAYQAATTAVLVAIGFIFLGKFLFAALGITVSDFQIAGGLVLFGLSVQDILSHNQRDEYEGENLGVVPLGMPLIAGPAMLTALLTLLESAGIVMTLISMLINVFIVLITLRFSEFFRRLLGLTALKAISRLTALLLAAIAINLIRRGWQAN